MATEQLPLYELSLEDLNFDAITAVSLVDFPAIEKDFIAFSKDKRNEFEFANADTEKRIVTGPALIPGKEIYRYDMFRGEYNVIFNAESVEKIQQEYLLRSKHQDVTVQHEVNANHISAIESWIIVDPENDKANALGFTDLPKGTWMLSMKINNDEVWDMIKSGEIKGFSIEAYLSKQLIENSATDINEKELNDLLNYEVPTDTLTSEQAEKVIADIDSLIAELDELNNNK